MARVLLIVGGGIAAYKSLELVRLLKKAGHAVTPVLTKGGEHFVTAMSLGTLAESQVHSSLWELKDEVEIGHIQLSRAADFVLVCPQPRTCWRKWRRASPTISRRRLLLATDKPVVVAPAMNVRMWQHAATQRNVAQLKADGVRVIEPAEGEMACGEFGPGRLPEPPGNRRPARRPSGVTSCRQACAGHCRTDARADRSGAGNRQSFVGKAGLCDCRRRRRGGCASDLDRGPVALATPDGVTRIDVETAEQMAQAVFAALPADAAVLVAAVADWRVKPSKSKLKKSGGPPELHFLPTRDILSELGASDRRPRLLVGFAAETEDVVEQATAKRAAKRADWIAANDVSGDVMGGSRNRVHLITADGAEDWPEATKEDVARRLVARIGEVLG